MTTYKEQYHQSYQHNGHDNTSKDHRAREDELCRDYSRHRPARTLYRRIVNVELGTVSIDGFHTRLAVNHLIAYMVINRVKIGLVQDTVTHRMGNISAALTHNIGICMMIEEGAVALHDSPHCLFLFIFNIQHPLIEVSVTFRHELCKPL